MNKPFLDSAEALLVELLAVPGVSCREGQIIDLIAGKLRAAGAAAADIQMDDAHQRSPRGGERGNLILKLPGTQRGSGPGPRPGPRRMLSAHADTVPLCEGATPVRRGRFLVPAAKTTGLGADDRAGTAVVLSAALEILRSGRPHPPLTFLWTVQEEIGLFGSRYGRMALLGKPKLAFNFDGGDLNKVTVGATSGVRIDIAIHGAAAHAGVSPEKGVSAIAIAALAIARLQREGWLGRIEKQGRTGTSNVGVIRGGDATNVVTPKVELRAEARSHDPIFRDRIVKKMERAFRDAAAAVRSSEGKRGSVKFAARIDYEAFRLCDDDPSVLAAEAAIRRIGGDPIRRVSNGGLDANWLSARGIPTVSLGCGQVNGHTVDEKLDISEFRRACQVGLLLATGEEE